MKPRVKLTPTKESIRTHTYNTSFHNKEGYLDLNYYNSNEYPDYEYEWEGKVIFDNMGYVPIGEHKQYVYFKDITFLNMRYFLAIKHKI